MLKFLVSPFFLFINLVTSQIRSSVKYLVPTHIILLLLFHSNLMRNLASLACFNTTAAYTFLDHPACSDWLVRHLASMASGKSYSSNLTHAPTR